MTTEYEVYRAVIECLVDEGWTIVCASPPGGTDLRFRRCLLPRSEKGREERGLRDEVDITAFCGEALLLVECKARLSESLSVLNALGESDYQKLHRLLATHPPEHLSRQLTRGTGVAGIPPMPRVISALAVSDLDADRPPDVALLVVGPDGASVDFVPPASDGDGWLSDG